jgi:hypothetical protein
VSALSEHDRMIERLNDWGFWGRQDCGRPDPEAGAGTIYDMGKSPPGGNVWTFYRCFWCRRDNPDPGKCEKCDLERIQVSERIPVEPPPPGIDVVDCEFLDIIIANKIGRTHRNVVKTFFYKRRPQNEMAVAAAVRAVQDAEYVARELGWAA